jgi:hypothetical protein
VRGLLEKLNPGGFIPGQISAIMGMERLQKITFGEMRESGVPDLLLRLSL